MNTKFNKLLSLIHKCYEGPGYDPQNGTVEIRFKTGDQREHLVVYDQQTGYAESIQRVGSTHRFYAT